MKRKRAKSVTPRVQLKALAHGIGCQLNTVGDIERLAGVNTNSLADRSALWNQFRSLYEGPAEILIDAVMDHCSALALARIAAGEVCLVPSRM
jgi:hypothetical protein